MRRTTVRRTMGIATIVLFMTATSCGYFKKSSIPYEISLEVTGAAADQISYTVPTEGGDSSDTVAKPPLPWTHTGVALAVKTGKLSVDVVPNGGPATCRIVVSKNEVAKQVGQPGAPLSCSTTLKGVD